ncbi:MAG: hypothetical protein GY707_09110 [Desulfobacteraceae bacterium]|nr:hypothetical protein [Desulfobacteraceae bacterium]
MITALTIKQNINEWGSILNAFGIDSEKLNGKHQPCPACGGVDRFRYDNKFGNGDFYCSGCGAGDGLSLIQRVNGWDFSTTAKELIKYLGLTDKPTTSYQKSKYKKQQDKAEYLQAKQLLECAIGSYKAGRKLTESEIEKAKECRVIVREYEECHL